MCDFIGKSEWTLQIHNGKYQSEKIECGLCDSKFTTLDGLDVHLKTCEIYECTNCEFVAKQLSEIKKHVKANKSECAESNIFHIKIDRKNKNETSFKEYEQKEIF